MKALFSESAVKRVEKIVYFVGVPLLIAAVTRTWRLYWGHLAAVKNVSSWIWGWGQGNGLIQADNFIDWYLNMSKYIFCYIILVIQVLLGEGA